MSSDLVAFIEQRLTEDERTARELSTFAGDGVWRESGGGLASGAYELLAAYRAEGSLSSWHLAHIARHDPARVLREVEAKRWILEAEQDRVIEEGPLPERLRDTVETDVIKLLALPYADHPDYRSEWAP